MLWSAADVKDGQVYVLHLYQAPDGERLFRLTVVGSSAHRNPGSDVVFVTRPVPNDLLRRRDLLSIAETVLLENGDKLCVDAHGTWFTAGELAAMNSEPNWSSIRWVTRRPPKLAPQ
jgi:hypothetical protein